MPDVETEVRRRGWGVRAKPSGRTDYPFVALIESDICPDGCDGWCRHFIGWGDSFASAMREAWAHYEEWRRSA